MRQLSLAFPLWITRKSYLQENPQPNPNPAGKHRNLAGLFWKTTVYPFWEKFLERIKELRANWDQSFFRICSRHYLRTKVNGDHRAPLNAPLTDNFKFVRLHLKIRQSIAR